MSSNAYDQHATTLVLRGNHFPFRNPDVRFEVSCADVQTGDGNGAASSSVTFYAHRFILEAFAPKLASLFTSNLFTSNVEKITAAAITNVNPTIFRHLLCYVYGGNVAEEELKARAKEIIEAADEYDMINLKLEAEVAYVKSKTAPKSPFATATTTTPANQAASSSSSAFPFPPMSKTKTAWKRPLATTAAAQVTFSASPSMSKVKTTPKSPFTESALVVSSSGIPPISISKMAPKRPFITAAIAPVASYSYSAFQPMSEMAPKSPFAKETRLNDRQTQTSIAESPSNFPPKSEWVHHYETSLPGEVLMQSDEYNLATIREATTFSDKMDTATLLSAREGFDEMSKSFSDSHAMARNLRDVAKGGIYKWKYYVEKVKVHASHKPFDEVLKAQLEIVTAEQHAIRHAIEGLKMNIDIATSAATQIRKNSNYRYEEKKEEMQQRIRKKKEELQQLIQLHEDEMRNMEEGIQQITHTKEKFDRGVVEKRDAEVTEFQKVLEGLRNHADSLMKENAKRLAVPFAFSESLKRGTELLRLGIDVNDSEVDTSESEEQDLGEMTEDFFAFLALIENNDTYALVDYFLEHYSAV